MARADGDGDENVITTRPLSTGACTTERPHAAAPGSAMNKAGKTPLVPQTGQSNSAELVEKCPPTTRHKVRNAVTTAEVKSPKLQTCDEQQPRGDWSHEPRDLDGSAGPRCTIARTTCETSAWKPLETRPHHVSGARGLRRRCLAQDSAGMDGLKRKNSQGRDPRTQERQEHSQLQANKEQSPLKTARDGTPRTKRADPQRVRRA